MRKATVAVSCLLVIVALITGCTRSGKMSSTGKGALIGSAVGAGTGALIGGGSGAAIGAIGGGAVGAAIGHSRRERDQ